MIWQTVSAKSPNLFQTVLGLVDLIASDSGVSVASWAKAPNVSSTCGATAPAPANSKADTLD